jgi:hypothetical protein
VSFRITVLRHDHAIEQVRLDRLADAGTHCIFKPADIDGQKHVGGARCAFRFHALFETAARRNDVDLDAGILGESLEQRLDQFLLAIGIDVDVAILRHGGGGDCDADGSQEGVTHGGGFHGSAPIDKGRGQRRQHATRRAVVARTGVIRAVVATEPGAWRQLKNARDINIL